MLGPGTLNPDMVATTLEEAYKEQEARREENKTSEVN